MKRRDDLAESAWDQWLETHRNADVPSELFDRIIAATVATETESGSADSHSADSDSADSDSDQGESTRLVQPRSLAATRSMIDFADSWIGKLVLGLSACSVGAIPYLFLLSTWKLF